MMQIRRGSAIKERSTPMNVSAATLSEHMAEVMDALDKNEKVILSHEGKDFALLQPVFDVEAEIERINNHPAVGMWADREDMKDPDEWLREKRLRRRERLWASAGENK
jgi:hypothetical protein